MNHNTEQKVSSHAALSLCTSGVGTWKAAKEAGHPNLVRQKPSISLISDQTPKANF